MLGDGAWIEEPWKSGQVAALGQLHQSLSSDASGTDLVWAISRQQAGDVEFWAPWTQIEAWDLGKAELELQALADMKLAEKNKHKGSKGGMSKDEREAYKQMQNEEAALRDDEDGEEESNQRSRICGRWCVTIW